LSENYQILDSSILFQKNEANNFSISQIGNIVNISFDYCDYAEGIILQIIHTGESSSNLEIKGSIHGVKSIVEKSLSKSVFSRIVNPTNDFLKKRLRSKTGELVMLVLLFVIPIFLLASAFFPEFPLHKKEASFWEKALPGVVVIILYWGFGFAILRSRPPKGFDIFNEEFLSEKN
jgi:hypothetical protein